MSVPTTSGQPGVRPRSWRFDAFYADEFHATEKNPQTQCFLSRFARPGAMAGAKPEDEPNTTYITELNPLEDPAQVAVIETTKGNAKAGRAWPFQGFVPDALLAKPPAKPNLCLFFGPPGPVTNRQGLRAFFEKSEVVLIVLPGIEDRPKFGIGIAPAQIDRLLAALFPTSPPEAGSWTIRTLAGYSTGFRGMNRSINDLYSAAQLKDVKKLVYYDCLYRHDTPSAAGGKSGEHTFRAMDKVLTNSPSAKFVVYELTGNVTSDVNAVIGGTPRRTDNSFWTRWPANADPLSSTNTVTEVINFKTGGQLDALKALACARLVEGGLKDGYFDRAFVKAWFKASGQLLVNAIDTQLKARGSYASTLKGAASGKTFVGNWLTPASDIPKLAALLESMRVPVISKFALLGWDLSASSTGDIAHDSHVPEFGWEHLLG